MESKGKWLCLVAVSLLIVTALAVTLVTSSRAQAGDPTAVIDSVNIGDTSSEAEHNLVGWTNIWSPCGWCGPDNNMRLIWGDGGETCDKVNNWASVTLDTGCKRALSLRVEHLDGAADDGFDVYVNGRLVGTYTDNYSSNTWLETTFDLSAVDYYFTGSLTIKFEATGKAWSGCSTYGQVAFNMIELRGSPFDFTLTATPETDFNPVNTNHSITASINLPVNGIVVNFDISGPNANQSGSATTHDGVATFAYQSNGIAGKDNVLVWVDQNCNQSYDENVDAAAEVEKYWLEHYVTGGGNINTGKSKKDAKITFGGNVGFTLVEGDPVGQWNINFHNVNVDTLDKGYFHATEITSLVFDLLDECPQPDPPDADYNKAIFKANGKFNGDDGWKIEVRLVDYGESGKDNDAIRIFLWQGSTLMYDTSEYGGGDFPDNQGCREGSRRHLLDGGNFQIHPPDLP